MSPGRKALDILAKFLVSRGYAAIRHALYLAHLAKVLAIITKVVGVLKTGSARCFQLYKMVGVA
jgi:hypothetical protein